MEINFSKFWYEFCDGLAVVESLDKRLFLFMAAIAFLFSFVCFIWVIYKIFDTTRRYFELHEHPERDPSNRSILLNGKFLWFIVLPFYCFLSASFVAVMYFIAQRVVGF